MLYGIGVFVAIAALSSNALSVRQARVVSQAPLKLVDNTNGEICDLKLWVRADDLSPSTIVEGDVRLLNNVSSLSAEAAAGCQILHWSLHLRYRERAAIQIPLSSLQLPKKPMYNYTWDSMTQGDKSYELDRMLNDGGDVTALFESTADPYEAEKQVYQQQLEEYAKAVSRGDQFVVGEDEITFFEAIKNMSTTLEVTGGKWV
jgi:hypothetical protein